MGLHRSKCPGREWYFGPTSGSDADPWPGGSSEKVQKLGEILKDLRLNVI